MSEMKDEFMKIVDRQSFHIPTQQSGKNITLKHNGETNLRMREHLKGCHSIDDQEVNK